MSNQNENNTFKSSNLIITDSSDAESLSARIYNDLNQNKSSNKQSKKSSKKVSKKST